MKLVSAVVAIAVLGAVGTAVAEPVASSGDGDVDPKRNLPRAFTAPGGAYEPYGPSNLTPGKQAQRARARRAAGFARPDVVKARRHRQLAARHESREKRARRAATVQLKRAGRLAGTDEADQFSDLARQQQAIADGHAQRQRYHLDGNLAALSAPVRGRPSATTQRAAADGQTLSAAADTCLLPPAPSPYSQYTFPAWSDISGWGASPTYYGTIQLADVTGDGADEVIGRSSRGMRISQMDQETGTFKALPKGPPLGDAEGFNTAWNAGSIRMGDIDGDKTGDLVYLDGAGRVVTYSGDATTGTWTIPSVFDDWASTQWSEYPTYYESLRLVDIDGDGDEELVGLTNEGLVTADWDAQTRSWTALPTQGTFSFANGWWTPQTGGTMQIAEIDGEPGAELVVMNSTQFIFTFSFDPTTKTWKSIGATNQPWSAQSQGTDWSDPAYYTTFRFANLIGGADSGPEIIARTANGIVVAQWNASTALWDTAPTSAILPDSAGWNMPQSYETMTIADLDGNGLDEIVIAGETQLQTYTYSEADSANEVAPGDAIPLPWSVTSSQPLVPSAWAEPSNYQTFRAGDVDGDGSDEVIFRDQSGVRTLTYENEQLVPRVTPFPEFTGSECAAYSAIVKLNKGVLNGNDLRASYGSGAAQLTMIDVPANPPSTSIPKSAWDTVAAQIRKELKAAEGVETWHTGDDGMSAVIEQGFSSQVGSIGLITSYFNPEPSQSVLADLVPILQGVVTAISLAAEPEGSIISAEVATAINSVIGTTSKALAPNGASTYELTQEESVLQGYVARQQQQATNANTANAATIPREYGMMLRLQDAPLPASTNPWQEMWRANDVYFWQQFANAFWTIDVCQGDLGRFDGNACDGSGNGNPGGWGYTTSDSYGYWLSGGIGEFGGAPEPASWNQAPDASLPTAYELLLTSPPSPECTPPFTATSSYVSGSCTLGIPSGSGANEQPYADFYLGQNGWQMPTKAVGTDN